MIDSSDLTKLETNSQRITGLFNKFIRQFQQKNQPELANRWKKILLNYQVAVKRKVQSLSK
ncbi:MAG: hypothetical protein ACTSUE_26735 [Promethearchaeota archaeon]